MEDSATKLTLQLDLARSRIRVHRNTLAALGNPEYILLIVNPEEKTLGIIETHNTPGAHRIKYSKGKQCQELYSTSLARQFRQVMPNWINGGKYLMTGDLMIDKLSDLVEVTALQNMTIAELRNKVEILVIDDQDFAAEEYLIKNGFRIVHKRDIDNIRDVSAYAVVLCDIRGVGKNLGSTKEGAFVIKEIKAHYPAKQVIAYTGSSYDPAYNEYMNLADAVISKGISIEDWTALVDDQIQKAVDPIYQWERLRKHLLECGVSTVYVAKLEDKYVRAIKEKNFEDLTKLANGTNDKARGLIADFTASVCAKVILGSI